VRLLIIHKNIEVTITHERFLLYKEKERKRERERERERERRYFGPFLFVENR